MKLKRQRMPFRRRRLRHAPQEFDGPFESVPDIDHLMVTSGTGTLKTLRESSADDVARVAQVDGGGRLV